MILCPKCNRPMEEGHVCGVVPAAPSVNDAMDKIFAALKNHRDYIQGIISHLDNLEKRVNKMEKKIRKAEKDNAVRSE